jgi:hypothetical protein
VGKFESWRRIECPKCDAKIGQACFFRGANYATVHRERREAAKRLYGSARIALPPAGPPSPAHLHKTRYWSKHCKQGHPELCKGVRKGSHGVGLQPCENPAHAIAMNVDFCTVDDSASIN